MASRTPAAYVLFCLLLVGCSTSSDFASKQKIAKRRLHASQALIEHDRPSDAAAYFLAKRSPSKLTRPQAVQLEFERLLAAVQRIQIMSQYSTVLQRILPSRAILLRISKAVVTEPGLATPSILEPQQARALGTWTPLGPGNVGGRTRSLLIRPDSPDVMFAAGVGGGVWKSSDGGVSWKPISDLLPNIAVSSLSMDPSNANVMYAGTGEGYFAVDSLRGAGIFRTGDGGSTWTRLTATANNVDFYYVQKIVVSPTASARIYAATNTGLHRSLDGGVTWSKLLDASGVNGCMDLAVQPNRTAPFLFISCGTFKQGTVYRMPDTETANAPTTVFQMPNMGRTSLAVAPSNPDVVYALASSNASGAYKWGLLGVFRSDKSGEAGSWTTQVTNLSKDKLSTVLLTNPAAAFSKECLFGTGDQFINQGWYDNVIAVDPKNAEVVWAGGVDLFRSDDAGKTWGVASYWWFEPQAETGPNPQYVHADNHAIVFHPQYDGTTNQIMYVANDGGVYRTEQARGSVGKTQVAVCGEPVDSAIAWTPRFGGYGVTQFYRGQPLPDGTTYIGGTQDNGTIFGADSVGVNGWREVQGGDGGYVAVDVSSPQNVYAAFPGCSITKSIDGGNHFASANNGLTETDSSGTVNCIGAFAFVTPFVIDPLNSARLWTGSDRIFRSTDAATTWAVASNVFTAANYPAEASGSVSAIAVAPTDSNVVYVGFAPLSAEEGSAAASSEGGWIHRTTSALSANATTKWERSRPRTGWVSSLAVHPKNPKIVYATYSTFDTVGNIGHVWRSTDAGLTWKRSDGAGKTAIPDIPVHILIIDPLDPSRLYIGTDLGVLMSLDEGATWRNENTGFPNVATESLAVDPKGTRLYAFTHGRGAWRVDLQ